MHDFLVINALLDICGKKVVASGVYTPRKCVFVKRVEHACDLYIGRMWLAAPTEMGTSIVNESQIGVTA